MSLSKVMLNAKIDLPMGKVKSSVSDPIKESLQKQQEKTDEGEEGADDLQTDSEIDDIFIDNLQEKAEDLNLKYGEQAQ